MSGGALWPGLPRPGFDLARPWKAGPQGTRLRRKAIQQTKFESEDLMLDHWVADRMGRIEASGIRKIFELGRSLKDPVNLSIGQPHFPVPEPIRQAAKAAIDRGDNGYTVTQGIPELHDRLLANVAHRLPGQDREVLVTAGTSGALML